MDRVTDEEALAQGIRGVLLGEAPGFLEALYDPGGIEDERLRPLVATMMADSARFLRKAREKLRPASVEVEREERRGTSYAVTLLVDGETRLEVVVDDVHERDGGLRTRDVLRIKVVSS